MEESFNVTGMSCAACQANVTKAVAKLNGVSNVDVSLLGNSMKVEYNPDVVDESQICAAVDNIGYGASPKVAKHASEENTLKKEWEERQARVEAESKASRRRLIWSVVLMIPLMYVAMGEMLHLPMPGILTGMENMMVNTLVQIILATTIIVIQKHFYVDGFRGLVKRAPNMDSLVALGSSASYIYAMAMTFIMAYAMGHGNMALAHHAGHSLYFDSSAMIVTLVSIGKYLESRSKAKTGDALGKLMDLAPKNATVIRNGKEVEIASDEVAAGDIVVIRPGNRIPVDGKVVSGTGYLDQSAITGESLPVEKQVGDEVISATINENGTFQFEAERVGDDTTLAQIVRLVDDAGTSKAPIARIADKVAGVFVPVVMGIALATFLGWMIFSGHFQTALNNGISVLVISCPCALGLATPMAIMVGTEKAARYGILLKSAVSLENLHNIDTIVLDKTGTITSGEPSLQNIKNYSDMSNDDFLTVAASIEKGSQHPLAEAIVNAAEDKELHIQDPDTFENVSGRGVKANIKGMNYIAGNAAFMKEEHVAMTNDIQDDMDALSNEGKTPMLFAENGKVLGILAVADTIRDTSHAAIQAFKDKGIHVVMLTGDNARTAKAIAKKLHVDEVISDVMPADKEAQIRRLQGEGRFVAMVGDGINDAPALTRADIGIAIGAGTDVAIDSADVVLMKNSLLDVNTAIDLSKATIRNIHQNLFWAFFYNAICIPLAIGILTPFTGWTMSPMIGALAMSLSSVCVCTNAWRLRFFKEPEVQVREVKDHDVKVISNVTEPEEIKGEPVTMHINGMMCDHCKAKVTNALKNIDGVTNVNVNVDAHLAAFNADNVKDETLNQAITDAGYEPVSIDRNHNQKENTTNSTTGNPIVTKTMGVDGMMCNHCASTVHHALIRVPGVKDVKVDLDSASAQITMDEKTSTVALKQAITDAGYTPGKWKEEE